MGGVVALVVFIGAAATNQSWPKKLAPIGYGVVLFFLALDILGSIGAGRMPIRSLVFSAAIEMILLVVAYPAGRWIKSQFDSEL